MATETTWDTDETSRIIANDEGLYDLAMDISDDVDSIEEMAEQMEFDFTAIVKDTPYSDVDLGQVDWTEIAAEYYEED